MNSDKSMNCMIIDGAMMDVLHDDFELKYIDENQIKSNDICVYNSSIIASPKTRTKDSLAIHWFEQSWASEKSTLKEILKSFLKTKLFFLYKYLR